MPGIRKVNIFGYASKSSLLKEVKDRDAHGDNYDSKQYCQSCLEYGIRSVLKRRMYKVEQVEGKPKLVRVAVAPNDADRFRQCYNCGDIVPIYNVKTESKIEDFVDTVDNPFDLNPGNMESFTPSRKSNVKSKSIYKRRKQFIESIKDGDIKKELLSGNTLENYIEH